MRPDGFSKMAKFYFHYILNFENIKNFTSQYMIAILLNCITLNNFCKKTDPQESFSEY